MRIKGHNGNGNPLEVDIPISNSIWKLLKVLVITFFVGIPFYLFAGSITILNLGWWYVLVIPCLLYIQVLFLFIGFNRVWVLYGINKEIVKVLEEVRTKQGIPPRVD